MRDMKKVTEKNREYLERHNPCLNEENLSRKCLNSNDNQKEKCEKYFMNLKNCRDFWDLIRKERRIRGIKPNLPIPEERIKIKEDYLKSGQYPAY